MAGLSSGSMSERSPTYVGSGFSLSHRELATAFDQVNRLLSARKKFNLNVSTPVNELRS